MTQKLDGVVPLTCQICVRSLINIRSEGFSLNLAHKAEVDTYIHTHTQQRCYIFFVESCARG